MPGANASFGEIEPIDSARLTILRSVHKRAGCLPLKGAHGSPGWSVGLAPRRNPGNRNRREESPVWAIPNLSDQPMRSNTSSVSPLQGSFGDNARPSQGFASLHLGLTHFAPSELGTIQNKVWQQTLKHSPPADPSTNRLGADAEACIFLCRRSSETVVTRSAHGANQ
jgi:hypothetical protein